MAASVRYSLTATERKRLVQACYDAVRYDKTLVDAYDGIKGREADRVRATATARAAQLLRLVKKLSQ